MRLKKAFLMLLVLLLLFPLLCRPVSAATEQDLICQILAYYGHHQKAAETDILRLLELLKQENPEAAEDWQQIVDKWNWVVEEYEVTWEVLPDGLPQDDSLCIIVMGFRLNYGGVMDQELIQRLEVALASAEKYPNAYIVCTGGGTTSSNPHVTEAGQMAAWLKENGVAAERIIVEDKSCSTEENAMNSYRILSRDYPHVKSLALVSSHYHLRRCHLLFNAAILLMDMPYTITADACFDAGYEGTNEGYLEEMESLGNMVGLNLENSPAPELCRLTGISVQGNSEYQIGDRLNLTVTAKYDNGYTRDVTDLAKIAAFDTTTPGQQTLLIQYEENNIPQECNFAVEVILPPATAPAALPPVTVPAAQEAVEIAQADVPYHGDLLMIFQWILGFALLISLGILIRSAFHRKNTHKGEENNENSLF